MSTILDRQEILDHALSIARSYDGNLTLRQLFYQFVSRGLHPDFSLPGAGQKYYSKIGNIISAARLNGDFPLDWLMDRTREAKLGAFSDDSTEVDGALDTCAFWMRNMPNDAVHRDRWIGQQTYVTVGVEKEALAGVFENPCEAIGVGLFVFRGYSSISAIYQWCKNYRTAFDSVPSDMDPIEEAVICYFGDHDPDGLEIPASSLRIIQKILKVKEWDDLPPVRIQRLALTRTQILQFNPPSFEAKKSSPRFKRYVARTGLEEAWELDALEPTELVRLIRAAAKPYFRWQTHEANRELIEERRGELWEKMGEQDWVSDLMDKGRRPSSDTSFWPSFRKDTIEEGEAVDPNEFEGGAGFDDED